MIRVKTGIKTVFVHLTTKLCIYIQLSCTGIVSKAQYNALTTLYCIHLVFSNFVFHKYAILNKIIKCMRSQYKSLLILTAARMLKYKREIKLQLFVDINLEPFLSNF